MATTEREDRDARIARERREMGIKPWQFPPSAVEMGSNPWAAVPSTAGFVSWGIAQQQRLELYRRDPSYFWDDDDDLKGMT